MFRRIKDIKNSKHVNHMRRHWLTIAFFLGFVMDNITLNRVDQLFDVLVLFTYVFLAMLSMITLYASTAGKLPERSIPKVRYYSQMVMQYAFGGLLSGMLIFYGRSGSWAESWPFLLVILSVIYFNETLHDRASRLVFSLAMLFVGLFSYVVLMVPVFTGYMGAWVFVGSGVLALFIMTLFIRILRLVVPHFIALNIRKIIFTIGTIFSVLNFLYFTNIIPPIPLSLKEVGVYHSVVRFDNGIYQLKFEKGEWWRFWKQSDDHFTAAAGESIFCFARVFAPTKINTNIYHRWQYYNEAKGEWVEHSLLSYPISGGRGDGYRGYTLIQNYREGKWRCSVETARGQVLGREVFTVSYGEAGELKIREE